MTIIENKTINMVVIRVCYDLVKKLLDNLGGILLDEKTRRKNVVLLKKYQARIFKTRWVASADRLKAARRSTPD